MLFLHDNVYLVARPMEPPKSEVTLIKIVSTSRLISLSTRYYAYSSFLNSHKLITYTKANITPDLLFPAPRTPKP